jgi:hypothetical protein
MKNFPFRPLFVCMFLPPVCYILTIQVLEGYLQKVETSRLNHVLVRDLDALYAGRHSIREEITRNVASYLSQGFKHALGVRTQILVTTKDGRILYPASLTKRPKDFDKSTDFYDDSMPSLNYVEVAAENYKILNDGLVLSVTVQIKHNTWLANTILVFYIFLFVCILRRYIEKGIRETERLDKEREELVRHLSEQLRRTESGIEAVKAEEAFYKEKIAESREDKKALSKDIDGLLEEIAGLEAGLNDQKELKEEMELEVLELREELGRLQEKLQRPKKKDKKIKATNKRFKILYKNLAFTDRALEGFLCLTDEFQMRAEEVIHKLNEDDSQVPVRRKVFGKGGKMNVLEVDFSYSGRIYFTRDSEPKTKIVAIGTKNTQKKDLAFLESVV